MWAVRHDVQESFRHLLKHADGSKPGSLFAAGSCLGLLFGESVTGLHLAQSQNWSSDLSLTNQGTPSSCPQWLA